MSLNEQQESRMAELLVNFSSDTANQILNRFEAVTREKVRARMSVLARHGHSRTDLLEEFAGFLYFDPREANRPATGANRRGQPHGGERPPRITFQEILGLDDASLDLLLQAATPELTISVLCCSPESFIHRVLGRLSASDAESVRQRINASDAIGIEEMKRIHQRYCDFAARLLERDVVQH